jgi:hypothetical protein
MNPARSRGVAVAIMGMAASAAIGSAFVLRPALTLGLMIVVCSVIYGLVLKRRLSRRFLTVLGFVLLGYAFLGRGFAYLGVQPFFVGEIALAIGILAATLSGGLPAVFRSRLAWLLVAFSIWGAFRTIPYINTHGIDALRDAAVWGYSAFALVVAACALPGRRWAQVVPDFRRVLPYYFAWIPVAWILVRVADDAIPTVPGNDVKLLVFNPSLVAVHLAGAATFVLLGLGGGRKRRTRTRDLLVKWTLSTTWMLAFVITASISRGGLFAVLASIMVVVLFRPMATTRKIVTACLFAGVMALVTPALFVGSVGTDSREFEDSRAISPGQLASNLSSVFSNRDDDLGGTARWRLLWWRSIIDYTLFGDYFWTGKGFGINLAEDDGFHTTVLSEDRPNRSPHNGHMTILARAGVPGAALWLLLQGSFGVALTRAYFRASQRRREWDARVTLWVLAYWVAFMVDSAFDVFLEGPYGGISFWSLFGLGIALLQDQRSLDRVSVPLGHAHTKRAFRRSQLLSPAGVESVVC